MRENEKSLDFFVKRTKISAFKEYNFFIFFNEVFQIDSLGKFFSGISGLGEYKKFCRDSSFYIKLKMF